MVPSIFHRELLIFESTHRILYFWRSLKVVFFHYLPVNHGHGGHRSGSYNGVCGAISSKTTGFEFWVKNVDVSGLNGTKASENFQVEITLQRSLFSYRSSAPSSNDSSFNATTNKYGREADSSGMMHDDTLEQSTNDTWSFGLWVAADFSSS